MCHDMLLLYFNLPRTWVIDMLLLYFNLLSTCVIDMLLLYLTYYAHVS